MKSRFAKKEKCSTLSSRSFIRRNGNGQVCGYRCRRGTGTQVRRRNAQTVQIFGRPCGFAPFFGGVLRPPDDSNRPDGHSSRRRSFVQIRRGRSAGLRTRLRRRDASGIRQKRFGKLERQSARHRFGSRRSAPLHRFRRHQPRHRPSVKGYGGCSRPARHRYGENGEKNARRIDANRQNGRPFDAVARSNASGFSVCRPVKSA